MRSTQRLASLVALVVVLSWAACGGPSVEGNVGPTGGEVCLPQNKVCIRVPIGGLETQEVLRISPGAEVPGGALSDGYDISSASGRPLVFVKAATVSFSLEPDVVRQGDLENENLLRVYTKGSGAGGSGEWEPLENAVVDRVRNVVRGETRHLSPFVVLRSDRLPDGGLPIEIDGGSMDAAVIVIPPFDAGRPDAGRPDAGPPDAGQPDAGQPDAGQPDAGEVDAGEVDAGIDAGEVDAGEVDAGEVDAGEVDAGIDAGDPDAGDDGGADAGDAG